MNHIAGNPERLRAVLTHCLEEFLRGDGRLMNITWRSAPPRMRNDVETLLSEMVSRLICAELPDGPEPPGMRIVHPAQYFLAAYRLTIQHSIGTAIIADRGRKTPHLGYGVIHRDTGWTGHCAGLTRVGGLEALVFCNENHDPDVIMAVPRRLLGQDPRETPGCQEAGDLSQRETNRTLVKVFRHHGAQPHFIDICGQTGDVATILGDLLSTPQE